MKNWIKTVCFLLWTCVMCTACIDDDVEEGTVDLQTGESISVFSVAMDDGQIITSETLKGEVSLIVFFHTGCPDCRKELPVLQKIYTDYGRRIRMVCISREESSAEIVRYWNENHLTLPYIIRKSKFPQNPKRSVRFSGKRTKRSVQKRKARNTQKAETKVL